MYSEVQEGVELYLYSPSVPSRHVIARTFIYFAYERKYVFFVGLHEICWV